MEREVPLDRPLSRIEALRAIAQIVVNARNPQLANEDHWHEVEMILWDAGIELPEES